MMYSDYINVIKYHLNLICFYNSYKTHLQFDNADIHHVEHIHDVDIHYKLHVLII